MPYTKTIWVDRDVQFPNRFQKVNENSTSVELVPMEGTILQAGTDITAELLNKMEQGIYDSISKDGGTVTGVLELTDTTKIMEIIESWNIFSTPPTTNIDIKSGSIHYFTSNTTSNFTLNFRGDNLTTMDSFLSVGKSVSCTVMVTNGTNAYYPSVFQIDGVNITPKWIGGTAVTAGNASSVDAYSITILKTASNTFTIFAGLTQFK